MTKYWIMAIALLALAGCGGRVALTPKTGNSLPAKPETASVVPTPEQLLVPDVQSRPKRSDEQLKRSEERQNDKFDLPPSF
jgi:uncharacterized lipoprotein YmbA